MTPNPDQRVCPRRSVTLLAVAGLLSACAQLSAPRSESTSNLHGTTLRGELGTRLRIALPPDSIGVVELRDGGGEGRLITEWRQALGGRQAPVPFEFKVGPQSQTSSRGYTVRGAIIVDGRPTLLSEAQPVTLGAGDIAVGTLQLMPYRPLAFTSMLRCGSLNARLGAGQRDGRDMPQLVVGERRFDLREVVSASGARYQAIDDAHTSVWVKGSRAKVVLSGETWPECEVHTMGAGPAAPVLRAHGNEPSWSLEIGSTLRFRTGGTSIEGAAPAARTQDGVRRHDGTVQGRAIAVAIREQRCMDSMSGMPYPRSVEVLIDGRTYRGCGGNPDDLLTGVEWVVEDIGGAGIVDRSRATLNFQGDGRVSGRGSCNAYAGSYTLTGESLAFGKVAASMMACTPALMQQEQRFFEVLQLVHRFEISDTGALILIARDGRMIAARRSG